MSGEYKVQADQPPRSQFFVQQDGRKPLFENSNPNVSQSQAESTIFSPDTRLPQPAATGFSNRGPISLTEAYKLAGGDDDTGEVHNPIDGSPSPAPRPWRQAREADQHRLRQQFGQDHVDTKSRLRELKDNQLPNGQLQGLPVSPLKKGSPLKRTSESARDLVEATERSSWNDLPRIGERMSAMSSLPDLVPGIEDIPIPSVESPAIRRTASANATPAKSFAWQIDEDFTAGDVQVSDSPRLKMNHQPFANRLAFDENGHVDINSRTRVNNPGSRNTKLDEIRSREVKAGSNIPFQRPPSRPPTSTKTDHAESSIPVPGRRFSGTSNTKIDDIRQREMEGLTKRQIASTRLEEIKDKNFNSRASMSPEARNRPVSRTDSRKTVNSESDRRKVTSPDSEKWISPKSTQSLRGDRIPDTPVTVYKSPRERTSSLAKAGVTSPFSRDSPELKRSESSQQRRTDSKDLLRQLARAASASPAPEADSKKTSPTEKSGQTSPPPRSPRRGVLAPTSSSLMRAKVNKEAKAKIGRMVDFTGLRRLRAESSGSKKSLRSDADPTDRLQAEAKLFELRDDMSEKGSKRGPSPAVKDTDEDEDEVDADADADEDVEATPKAKREDPLTMPTPQVTGAYVQTPATVKVERIGDTQMSPFEEGIDAKLAKLREERANIAKGIIDDDTASEPDESATKRATSIVRAREDDTLSDPGSDSKNHSLAGALSQGRRRAHSLGRRAPSIPRRRLSLQNTAKVPSVKSDLTDLKRTYNIEDSTLDDFEEILAGRKAPTSQMEVLMDKMPEENDEDSFDLRMEQSIAEQKEGNGRPESRGKNTERETTESEMAAYDRMSKSLATSLLGIRDAKKGMERLEDNLAQHEQRSAVNVKVEEDNEEVESKTDSKKLNGATKIKVDSGPRSIASPDSSVAYVKLPLPKLYQKKPSTHLTPLGLILMAMGLWYAIEVGMCALYCSPTSCSSAPCVWSYDDPTFGTALPVKIDQWVTGGSGRKVFNNVLEEAEDLIADVVDVAHGRQITDVDVELLSFEQKRKHRRRLRKKGLEPRIKVDASPEVRARWESWRRERLARERAREARSMGYSAPVDADASIGSDQRAW